MEDENETESMPFASAFENLVLKYTQGVRGVKESMQCEWEWAAKLPAPALSLAKTKCQMVHEYST